MTVENDKGEKEILLDVQSFQLGYRAAVQDLTREPSSGLSISIVLISALISYGLLSFLCRDK